MKKRTKLIKGDFYSLYIIKEQKYENFLLYLFLNFQNI